MNWSTGSKGLIATVGMMIAGAAPASAQLYKAGDLTITGSISGTTDYVFRGVSQSREKPALQGTVDGSYKWFYAGTFVSMIEFGGDDGAGNFVPPNGGFTIATAEIDVYGGLKIPLGKMIELDVGVIGYIYPGARDGKGGVVQELDYVEGKLGATFKPIDPLALTVFGYYSPEYTNKTGAVFTLESAATYTFPEFAKVVTAVSALLGYQTGDDVRYKAFVANGDDNYLYWNAGVSFTFAERLSLDFRYWDSNISDLNKFCTGTVLQCDERFVATAKVTF